MTANLPATGEPFISGTPRVGGTLTADTTGVADGDGLENVDFIYQWMRIDGAVETNIGTGSSSYTLVAEDSGKTIKVRVTFTDDADHEETLTSAATGVVAGQAQLSGHGSAHHHWYGPGGRDADSGRFRRQR